MSTIRIGSNTGDDKKADEKRTKEIRDFQRSTPANKRCFDCNEMMPQYIVLDFNTFVCTTCSGIHREFAHRIKGISMSKFTDTEVKNLLKFGGNDAAQKYWRAKHDANFRPNGGTEGERTRNFIRLTYIDRKWVYESPREGKQEQISRTSSNNNTSSDFFSSATSSKTNQTPSFDAFGGGSNGFGDFSNIDDSFSGKTSSQSNKSSSNGFGDFSFTSTPSPAPPLSAAFKTGSFTLAPPPGSSFTSAVSTPAPSTSNDLFEFSPPKPTPPTNDPFGFDAPPGPKSVSRTSSNSSHQSFDAFGSTAHAPSNTSQAGFNAFGTSSASQPAITQTSSSSFDAFGAPSTFDAFGAAPRTPSTNRSNSSSFDAFDAVANATPKVPTPASSFEATPTTPSTTRPTSSSFDAFDAVSTATATPTAVTPSSPFNAFGATPTTPSTSRPSSSSFDAFDAVATTAPAVATPSSPFNAFGAPTTSSSNRPTSSSFDAFDTVATPTPVVSSPFNAFGAAPTTPSSSQSSFDAFGAPSHSQPTATVPPSFNAFGGSTPSTPSFGSGSGVGGFNNAFNATTSPTGFGAFDSPAVGARVSSGSFSSTGASASTPLAGGGMAALNDGQARTASGIKKVEPPKSTVVNDDPYSALDAVHATGFDAFNNMATTTTRSSQASSPAPDPFSFSGGAVAGQPSSVSNSTTLSPSTNPNIPAADPFAFGSSGSSPSFNSTPATGLSGMGGSSSSLQPHQHQPTNGGFGGMFGHQMPQSQQPFGGFSNPQQQHAGISQQQGHQQQQVGQHHVQQGQYGGQQPTQHQGQFSGQFSQQSGFGVSSQQQHPQQWMQGNHSVFDSGLNSGSHGQSQNQAIHHTAPTPPSPSTPAALNDPFASLGLGNLGLSSGPAKPPATSSRGNSFSTPSVPVTTGSSINNNSPFGNFQSPSTGSRDTSFDANRVNSKGSFSSGSQSMNSFGFQSQPTSAPVKQSSFENVNAFGAFGTPAPRTDSQSSANPFDMF